MIPLNRFPALLESLGQKTGLLAIESVVVPAASKMVGSILQRNTNEGKNTDGSRRRSYSTKPMYAAQKQFVVRGAFSPRGKNNTKKDKSPKTMYLPGGYEELRKVQGRRTDVTNFEYSGDLVKDFDLQSKEKKVVIGFKSERSALIRKGLEAKFGKAFPPGADEIAAYKEEVVEGTKDLQFKVITGIS